jgi:hypothetical protein
MTQAKRGCAHIERIMLVCGKQNAGKSRLLRAMLADQRLVGEVSSARRLAACPLSRERALIIRCSSPHEYGDDTNQFHAKIQKAAARLWWAGYRRMNFACAIQPDQHNHMPGIIQVCDDLIKVFAPERIRVVQLAPDQGGKLDSRLSNTEVDGLRQFRDVETLSIDARKRAGVFAEPGSVRILADYFDFS